MEPGEHLTFYEIDYTVEHIAQNPRYFTYLRDCFLQGRVVLGDARLSLRHASDHSYGILFIDAFSGDSIPVHLLTREAMHLYLSKVQEGGLLAFHISNRYFDLQPVLGKLAADAGLTSLIENDTAVSEAKIQEGRLPSVWVVMAHQSDEVGKLAHDPRWQPLRGDSGSHVWTDDFSNVARIIKWNSN